MQRWTSFCPIARWSSLAAAFVTLSLAASASAASAKPSADCKYGKKPYRGKCYYPAKLAKLKKADEKEDKADCGKARTAATIDAWEGYTKKFPEGSCLTEATIRLEEMKKKQAAPPAAPAPQAPAASKTLADEVPSDDGSSSGIFANTSPMRLAAYGSFGVGAVGVVLGITFGVIAVNTGDDTFARYDCYEGSCPPESEADFDVVKANGNVATAGWIIGALGVAGGTTLFFLSSDTKKDAAESSGNNAQRIELRPRIGLGYLGLDGRF
jgi:hypothetical protein